MADALRFDLVSPERLLLSEEVAQVVVPGAEGYFTALAGHAPFMTTLKPGVVDITRAGGEVLRVFVRGGFADVNAAGLTILAEQALPLDEIDAETLAREIRNGEEDLSDVAEDHARRAAAEKRLNDLRDVQRWLLPA